MRAEYLAECSLLLREYFGYTETVKGRGSLTVDGYFTDLRSFFRYAKRTRGLASPTVEDKEIPISDIDIPFVEQVSLSEVYAYLNHQKNECGNNRTTLARKCCSLRQFFRYLTDITGQLEHNPVKNLGTPKLDQTLPKHLTLDQSKRLLSAVGGTYPERDYCMLTLLLNCGLRRAELAQLNLTDIQDDMLRIHGKGGKERVVYLNDACAAALAAYLKVRPVDGVRAKDKNALFLGHTKERISLQGVHFIVKGYLRQIPGAETMSTHKLRHTAATMMYQYGHVDIRALQEILGHKNLNTTEIYTHVSSEQMKKAADSNPLAHEAPKKPPKEPT